MESSTSLFSLLNLALPSPTPKSAWVMLPPLNTPIVFPPMSFADTNWKRGPWQNGQNWMKENISVIVMLIEDAIVRMGGNGGVLCVCTSFDYPWYFHTFFIYRKEKCSFSNYLDNAKKEESGICSNVSGFPQLKESWVTKEKYGGFFCLSLSFNNFFFNHQLIIVKDPNFKNIRLHRGFISSLLFISWMIWTFILISQGVLGMNLEVKVDIHCFPAIKLDYKLS